MAFLTLLSGAFVAGGWWLLPREPVGWTYSPGSEKSKRLRRVNTAIAGVEAALPDTYGMSVEQLAGLMNQLRDRHAAVKRRD
jgi:hypothetical protein